MRTTARNLMLAAMAVCLFSGADWAQFRGTDGNGVSEDTNLPITFGETPGGDENQQAENVAWKVPLPGSGPSSPIVVGDRVVVTCASGYREDRLHVSCFDTKTGNLLWHRQLWATGHIAFHPFGGIAAPTPASDGRLIYAFYSSNDLACFDLDGNLKWFRGLAYDYPTARNDVGMSSSPLAFPGIVVVQVENQGESFAAGIGSADGKTRWRIEREHDAMWASPTLLRGKTPQEDLVLLQGRSRLTAHNPYTGKMLWSFPAFCHTIASATTAGDRVYLPAEVMYALQCDPQHDSAKLLWSENRLRSGNASPVVHDGRIYVVKPPGILVCGDAGDGSVLWQMRLKGPFWATPVLADGRLYCVNHQGLVQVVELGDRGTLVGTCQIDGTALAMPAVADGALYFRTNSELWKVALDRPRHAEK